MADTEMKLRGFLTRYFRKHELKNDEDMFSLGFVNSLFAMQLVMFLEKEFAMKIETKDLNIENFRTINNIVALIENKIRVQGGV
jgi:methoxymalonate biosynthesis acyl carrier protein